MVREGMKLDQIEAQGKSAAPDVAEAKGGAAEPSKGGKGTDDDDDDGDDKGYK